MPFRIYLECILYFITVIISYRHEDTASLSQGSKILTILVLSRSGKTSAKKIPDRDPDTDQHQN